MTTVNNAGTVQYSIKDLLAQVLSRLDHLDVQMSVVTSQLQGQGEISRRLALVEGDHSKLERLLAVHEARPSHETSPAQAQQNHIERLDTAMADMRTTGRVRDASALAEASASRWRTHMLLISVGQAASLILFVLVQLLRH